MTVGHQSRVVVDPIEAGIESRQAMWGSKMFRRAFRLTHSGLTEAEAIILNEFFADRQGTMDSFWFRDSINRSGNHRVRFNESLKPSITRENRSVEMNLVEVGPREQLPTVDEATEGAGGNAPLIWIDANRERVTSHIGVDTFESGGYDVVSRSDFGIWEGAGARVGGLAGPFSWYPFAGSSWLSSYQSAAPINLVIHVVFRAPASSTKQVIFSVGEVGAGSAAGVCLTAAGKLEPWYGGTEVFTGASYTCPANTWLSVTIPFYGPPNYETRLYINGVAFGSVVSGVSRALMAASAIALGAAPNGSLPFFGDVAHALVLPITMGSGDFPTLHNLLAPMYGLPLA